MTPDLRLSLLKYGKDNAKKQRLGQKREISPVRKGIFPLLGKLEGTV